MNLLIKSTGKFRFSGAGAFCLRGPNAGAYKMLASLNCALRSATQLSTLFRMLTSRVKTGRGGSKPHLAPKRAAGTEQLPGTRPSHVQQLTSELRWRLQGKLRLEMPSYKRPSLRAGLYEISSWLEVDGAASVCTDRNFLTRVWFVALTLERKTWASREKGKHGGALGRSALELLRTLLFVVSKGEGKLYPSLDELARLARMSRQTVISAIERLKSLGFITVHRRIKRIRTSLGLRVVQDSNAYVYDLPTGLGALGWATICRSESKQFYCKRNTKDKKEAWQ